MRTETVVAATVVLVVGAGADVVAEDVVASEGVVCCVEVVATVVRSCTVLYLARVVCCVLGGGF